MSRLSLLMVCALVAIAAPAAREAGTAPPQQDSRLEKRYDLDHPFTFTPDFKTREQWLARRNALRNQVLVAVGLWPMPARTPLAPVVHGRIERDGYTVEKVFFASMPGHYVTGNLYRPFGRQGKRPAVLAAHGHFENGRLLERPDKSVQTLVAQGAERTPEAARHPHQARAANLARLGFVVFHYDMVGYADSKPLIHREGFRDADAMLRLQSNMGLQTWNSVRALDFVTSLPDVDPSRVGVTGESGGGTQTILLSAIDDRITASFPMVMVSGAMQGGCVCENAPLLRVGTNNIELAALFAPKPLGMSAANDWTRDLFKLGLPEIKTIYGLFGAADRVAAVHQPFEHGDHLLSRELMYSFFSRHLRPTGPALSERKSPGRAEGPALSERKSPGRAEGAIVEPPFTPVPPAELSVFDAAHPRPSDEIDVVALRRNLTRDSDQQMAALSREPARYREVVSTALEAMINDPLASRVEVLDDKAEPAQPATGSLAVRRLRLVRPGKAGAVPVAMLTPRSWTGGGPTVVWAHPSGRSSVFGADAATPVPTVQWLLERGARVIVPDVFLSAGSAADAQGGRLPRVKDDERFATYNYGYNRALLAERVRDLLTTVAFAKAQQPGPVHLVAFDRAGVWALLSRALAGNSIARASIDLDRFDFGGIEDPFDPMMLPGAVKYGGIGGFLPLITTGQTEVYRAPPAALESEAGRRRPAGLVVRDGSPEADRMVRWLMGDR
jgi:dienelactone hydrolase